MSEGYLPIERLRLLRKEPPSINGAIVVLGNRALEFTDQLAERAGPIQCSSEASDEPFMHLPIRLPDVRAFELWLHLYVANVSNDLPEQAFWHHFQHTRFMVIASDGPGIDMSWRRLFDKATRAIDAHRQDMQVALWGRPSLRDSWLVCGGREPLIVSGACDAVVEALAKALLSSLKRPAAG